MRHALFVAFHYPPESSSSGVLRTLKYTRYLPEHGWRVTVITLRRSAYRLVDPALEAQIPPSVRVVRTAFVNLKRVAVRGVHVSSLEIPDAWNGWWPWAVAAGRRVLREDPADLIYSTSPVATAHLIARTLARRARRPWVADFRDPWYEEVRNPETPALAHWAGRRLERRVVHAAAAVTTTTERMTAAFRRRYPEIPPERFVTIPNGYDEADFAAMPSALRARGERLVLLHAGGIDVRFRDPRPLLRAIRRAADAGRLDPARICVRFLGVSRFGRSPAMVDALASTGLGGSVDFVPRVPHEEALRQQAEADVLVLLQASADTASLIPAKLFEYLRTGRPVLALAGEGAIADVMRETGGGWIVDPRDADGLLATVVTAYEAWRAGALGRHLAARERLERFERRRLTGELARVFVHAIGTARAGAVGAAGGA